MHPFPLKRHNLFSPDTLREADPLERGKWGREEETVATSDQGSFSLQCDHDTQVKSCKMHLVDHSVNACSPHPSTGIFLLLTRSIFLARFSHTKSNLSTLVPAHCPRSLFSRKKAPESTRKLYKRYDYVIKVPFGFSQWKVSVSQNNIEMRVLSSILAFNLWLSARLVVRFRPKRQSGRHSFEWKERWVAVCESTSEERSERKKRWDWWTWPWVTRYIRAVTHCMYHIWLMTAGDKFCLSEYETTRAAERSLTRRTPFKWDYRVR